MTDTAAPDENPLATPESGWNWWILGLGTCVSAFILLLMGFVFVIRRARRP